MCVLAVVCALWFEWAQCARVSVALIQLLSDHLLVCMCVCGLQARAAEDPVVAAARAMSPAVCVAVLPCSCDVMCACTVIVFIVCLICNCQRACLRRIPVAACVCLCVWVALGWPVKVAHHILHVLLLIHSLRRLRAGVISCTLCLSMILLCCACGAVWLACVVA